MQTEITLKEAVHNFEEKNLSKFKPTKKFYERMKINRIRFSQLVDGKKQMFATEQKVLSDFFQVEITEPASQKLK